MRNEKSKLRNLLDNQLSKDNVIYLTEDLFITDNIRHIPPLKEHIHIDLSLYVICQVGQMHITINGNEYQIKKNGILICTGLHIISDAMISTDFKCSIIGISHKKLVELFIGDNETVSHFLCIKDNPVIQLEDEDIYLLKLYKDIFDVKCRDSETQYSNLIIDKLLYAVIYELIQIYTKHTSFSKEVDLSSTRGYSYGQRFLALLTEDKCRHRKVEYYAEKLCITPRYLSVICCKETGKTPSEWIKEQIVGHIRYYLLNTTLSVKEICSELDFPNSSFFCKFTKQHLGMTPMEYRNNNTKSLEKMI